MLTPQQILLPFKKCLRNKKKKNPLVRDYFMQFNEFGYILCKRLPNIQSKGKNTSLLLLLYFHKQHITIISFQLDKQDSF